MGGFGCPCGNGFKDGNDYVPYKAHLIADQDYEDFQKAVLASDWRAQNDLARNVYQCPSCSRLHIFSGNEVHTFVPDGDSGNLLRSVKGEGWRRFLRGSWNDAEGRGYVYWGDTGTAGGDNGWVSLNSLAEVEKLYFEVFQRLKDAAQLRNALLQCYAGTKNVKSIHRWDYCRDENQELAKPQEPAKPTDVCGLYSLAYQYEMGDGVPQDYGRAVSLYREAIDLAKAEQKDMFKNGSAAKCNLADKYEHGVGVPQNYKQALYWYIKAAEQENHVAQYSLGNMYKDGRGVPQDLELARAWFAKSAAHGYEPAQIALANISNPQGN